MLVLLRDEIGDGPNADVEAVILKVTRVEMFPDRIAIVMDGEHKEILLDQDGDFAFQSKLYGFCIVYEDAALQILTEEFNLI